MRLPRFASLLALILLVTGTLVVVTCVALRKKRPQPEAVASNTAPQPEPSKNEIGDGAPSATAAREWQGPCYLTTKEAEAAIGHEVLAGVPTADTVDGVKIARCSYPLAGEEKGSFRISISRYPDARKADWAYKKAMRTGDVPKLPVHVGDRALAGVGMMDGHPQGRLVARKKPNIFLEVGAHNAKTTIEKLTAAGRTILSRTASRVTPPPGE
jgi:hypothetical protein